MPWIIWKAKGYDIIRQAPRELGVQYATGEQQKNSSKNNEDIEPNWKWCSPVYVSDSESNFQILKEQYCIGIWNVGVMNQYKLNVVNQEMARASTDILGISKLKWMNLIQMNIVSTTVGKNPLEEME